MTSLLYLGALLISAAGMAVLDRRFSLVLWHAPRRAAIVLALGAGFFLLWDLAAIGSGHYMAGQSPGMTGVMIAPELPLEELVFITFLSYTTLVLRGLIDEAGRRRRTGRRQEAGRGREAVPGSAAGRRRRPAGREEAP